MAARRGIESCGRTFIILFCDTLLDFGGVLQQLVDLFHQEFEVD
jgi:hypothetical protein